MVLQLTNLIVYLAIWNSAQVAAKKWKDASKEEEFRKELAILRY